MATDIPRRYKVPTGDILRFASSGFACQAVVAAPPVAAAAADNNNNENAAFLPYDERPKTYLAPENAPQTMQLMAVSVPLRLVCCATPTGG